MNAPAEYARTFDALPIGTTITKDITKDHTSIHLFVKKWTALEKLQRCWPA
ncbi:MAG: hypothetical protein KA791_11945 [Flavobacteriales bacterium]|nr:hypothetical protein [Flavobacteriales bacterium]